MSQTNEPAQESPLPLAQVVRARPRVLRGLAWGAVIALVAALAAIGVVFLVYRTHEPDCLAVARTENAATIVLVCERAYLRTGDPVVGVQLADAQRRSKNFAVARAIAQGLLVTPARAEAFRVLGKLAKAENRLDEALGLLGTARDLHRAQARRAELAKDDQAIAGILQDRQQFAKAMGMLDECITEAHAADDRIIEGYCHASAAYVLSIAGSFEGAQQELDRAQPLLIKGQDLAFFEYEQGNLYQEQLRSPVGGGGHKQAIGLFKDVLTRAERAQLPDLVLSTELNLAASLAEDQQMAEAEQYLAAAKLLDANDAHATDRAEIEARIAYRRGDLALAASLNDRLYPKLTDDDERIAVCAMQAHIALASNDLVRAEAWARRGIARAEQLRAAQSIELRSWVLSTRREPYELLFTALARAGRADDALDAFDQWQGRSLLDAVSKPLPAAPLDLRNAASRLENFGSWLPAVSDAPLMKQRPADHRAIEAVRSIDLLGLVIADHQLWCITVARGQVHLDDLGPFAARKELIDRFTAAPTDRALADELGGLLLRDPIVRNTPETLRVVLDGPLAALPVPALRRHGQPLIAIRPIIRAPRISEVACAARPSQPGTAIVLADAAGDLPGARAEAQDMAALLGTTSAVGEAATSTALYAAKRNDFLHVAVHASIDASGGYLALHDRNVHALDISAHQLGPALVVLAACDSALSDDLELAGALATGFLAGGSTQVMATLRPITDPGARELTERFYREGGANDPVRVLARIQASLADSRNTDWPSFAVFGHDLCHGSPNR